jgi:hypothetical protein
MAKTRQATYFVFRTKPFRPLFLGGEFHRPQKGGRQHLWLFRNRDVARKLAALNTCEYADFRDYVRCYDDRPPAMPTSGANRRSAKQSTKPIPPTLDDIA